MRAQTTRTPTSPSRPHPGTSRGDAVLAVRAQRGDRDAVDALLRRYRPLVERKASAYYLQRAERDDVVQEGLVGLWRAIRTFRPGRGASFGGFALLCVERQIQTAVTASRRRRHEPLARSSPIDRPGHAGDERDVAEAIADPRRDLAEEAALAETVRGLVDVAQELSPLERAAFVGALDGRSLRDTGWRIGCSQKQVDNALQRAKRKARSLLAATCLLLLAGGLSGCAVAQDVAAEPSRATVTRVVDGDTIRLESPAGDAIEELDVRLLGLDTPETRPAGSPVECGGREASSAMLELAFTAPLDTDRDGLFDRPGGRGRTVDLEYDPTHEPEDRYGRRVAYVRAEDGRLFQLEQLRRGLATVYVHRGQPFERLADFRGAEASARRAGRGAWGACGGDFHRPTRLTRAAEGRLR